MPGPEGANLNPSCKLVQVRERLLLLISERGFVFEYVLPIQLPFL